ncbi:hypothetical protein J6TS2_49040 [Heyndrickxia sporothermodurans]|nr:hypothetical protein J6TS2_49040 [Heyndrickxia sporothermodurans]
MKINCNCQENTNEIVIEADYGIDPIWCKNCGTNLDIDELPLTQSLKREVEQWVVDYGNWIDWETDKLIVNGEQLEKKYNEIGKKLTKKVKEELKEFSVVYKPSDTAGLYKNIK